MSLPQRQVANQLSQSSTCLNRLPNVQCTRDQDCQKWLNQNCSPSDLAITRGLCDLKEGKYDQGVCAFVGNGNNAPIYGGS